MSDAAKILLALVAVMWAVEVVDVVADHQLDQYGIEARETEGLDGVVTAPFLHVGFGHLVGNTIPFVILGLLIAFEGARRLLGVFAIVALVSGLGTWLVAPEGTIHVGASGVVFGFSTYLIARGWFNRRPGQIAIGLVSWSRSGAACCSAGSSRARGSPGRATCSAPSADSWRRACWREATPSGRPPRRSICRVEVTVRLFAMLRERAGAPELTLELPDGARVRDALASEPLAALADGIPLVMAVNREYADGEQVLDAGDELALIPPVSGGSTAAAPWVRVSAEPLSLDALARARARPARRRRGDVLRRHARGGAARVRGLRGDGRGAHARDRGGGRRDARPVRCGSGAPRGRRAALGAERDRGGVGAAPGRGVRGSARDHRPGQGRGADLEEGDRGRRGALGQGLQPAALSEPASEPQQ